MGKYTMKINVEDGLIKYIDKFLLEQADIKEHLNSKLVRDLIIDKSKRCLLISLKKYFEEEYISEILSTRLWGDLRKVLNDVYKELVTEAMDDYVSRQNK